MEHRSPSLSHLLEPREKSKSKHCDMLGAIGMRIKKGNFTAVVNASTNAFNLIRDGQSI